MNGPLLEIVQAEVFRGENRVFDALDLTIPSDRSTVIIGPNGSGKSTLIKLLTREIYPVDHPRTSVRVLGQRVWDLFELRRNLGIVSLDLQTTHLRRFRAIEVVVSGFFSSIGLHPNLDVRDAHYAQAVEALAQLGIAELAERAFMELSTGEQRRCLLARALIHDPPILVLDEPTVGLDIPASYGLIHRLRALVGAGKRVVMVTHHLDEVLPEITHAVLLRDGRVVAEGERSVVLTESKLTETFGVPIALSEHNGFLRATPASIPR